MDRVQQYSLYPTDILSLALSKHDVNTLSLVYSKSDNKYCGKKA